MRVLRPASAAEVVSVFLQAELNSPIYGDRVRQALAEEGARTEVVTAPRLGDGDENRMRARVLGRHRGWPSSRLFEDFPPDVAWRLVELRLEELLASRYMCDPMWVQLTGGTRQVADGVAGVRRPPLPFSTDPAVFTSLAAAIVRTGTVAPLILVGVREDALTLLEGHARATALGLAAAVETVIPAYVGISSGMASWTDPGPTPAPSDRSGR